MRSRFRLRSHAAGTPERDAFCGSTLLTMKTWSRMPRRRRDDLFGAAAGVHLGRVDQGHSQIDTQAQRIRLPRWPLPASRPCTRFPGRWREPSRRLAMQPFASVGQSFRHPHHPKKVSAPQFFKGAPGRSRAGRVRR